MNKIAIDKMRILSADQKERFLNYLPGKVYKTERNISILVVLSQLCMITLFLMNNEVKFDHSRGMQYFSLYVFLLVATIIAIIAYGYTMKRKLFKTFMWIRRIYAVVLCMWVLGITVLSSMHGKGVTVYCYLMPTMAALLLLSPLESTIIFVTTWIIMICLFLVEQGSYSIFSDVVNSTFVTVLTLFISYRYYRSTAVEFCDRETISSQYQEIEKSNTLLQQIAQVDQLTGLYNRRYLQGTLYPLFENNQKKRYYGMFLMIDIDYFKQYNDTYGHLQGDACLKELAGVLEDFAQKDHASAIRYGGEEFLIIKMSNVGFDAEEFANTLLSAVQDINLHRDDVEFDRVTVSMGLWYQNLTSTPHIETAIKMADDALYKAKETGRNRIIWNHEDNGM